MAYLEEPEIESLLEAMEPGWLRCMTVLALNTGLRLGELLALQHNDADLPRRRLLVRRNLNDDGSIGTPKSGRNREVPLNSLAVQALAQQAAYCPGKPFIFARVSGQPLTRMMAYGPLILAFKRCHLDKSVAGGKRRLGWHMLRHTFASQLVMRGVPLRAVQELLGHASLDMTLRYAHIAPAATQTAVDMLTVLKP